MAELRRDPAYEYACAVSKLLNNTVFNTWQLCYRMSNKSWFFGTQTTSRFVALEPSDSPSTRMARAR